MLEACRWLALEVKDPEQIASFYTDHLSVPIVAESDTEVAVDVGSNTQIKFRRPHGVPRGGLHTHYALSCSADAYELWRDRLEQHFDLQEVKFGSMRSLYFYDPAENCVEIGGTDDVRCVDTPSLSGIFEVVLEVESLPDAVAFYTDLGFEQVDTGDNRRRTRLTTGPFDIELWEPQLGIADARGGVHVDLAIEADAPHTAVETVEDRILKQDSVPGGVRIEDPDGHYLTLLA